MKNVQPRRKAKKFRKMSHLSLVSRLGINSAIINCEDIINSRLDREIVEAQGDGNRFKMREECARERKGGRDYIEIRRRSEKRR